MAPGKIASQAGHAYLGAYLDSTAKTPAVASAYAQEAPGTKVCLHGSLNSILKAAAEAERLGVPHFLVVDSGCANFFNGEPTVTALGLGPATREQVKPITKKFNLL